MEQLIVFDSAEGTLTIYNVKNYPILDEPNIDMDEILTQFGFDPIYCTTMWSRDTNIEIR